MAHTEAGDILAIDVTMMEGARTWGDMENLCRVTDEYYDRLPADDAIRRAYENIKRRHAQRVASTLAA